MPEIEVEQNRTSNEMFNLIKSELARKGITQRSLAKAFSVSPEAFNRAIHGFNSPQAKELREKTYKFLDIK